MYLLKWMLQYQSVLFLFSFLTFKNFQKAWNIVYDASHMDHFYNTCIAPLASLHLHIKKNSLETL